MTESLISALSRIEELKVISSGSVFRFKGKEVDPRDAARQLGVAAVLEGSVRQDAESVHVTVRLVSAEDSRVLWASDNYNRTRAEIFTIQDEIASGVAAALRVKLSGKGEQRLARRYTEDVEAYRLYLIGRYHLNKRSEHGFKRAIEYFEQAIAKDPNYALAYAGLADGHALLSPYYAIKTPKEAHLKAKAAATKALEIDDQLAEVHTSLGNITWLYEWDWSTAEKEFRRAIELNPNYATAHQWYAACLSSMGRHKEAIREGKKALELDPLSLPTIRDLTRCFYHARQYDEAIGQYMRTFELEPNHYRLNSWLEMAYEKKGLYDQAIELRMKALAIIGAPDAIAAGKKAFAESGWKGYWEKELELAEERIRQKRPYLTPAYNMARICTRIGQKEQALGWLQKAYDERSDHMVLVKVDPIFDDLRNDQRFADLVRRVGLVP